MANTVTDNKTTDDGVPKKPTSAFDEHLPLSDAKIERIKAEAATNTNLHINENEGNDPNPVMG